MKLEELDKRNMIECEIETLRTLVGDGKPEPALTTKEEPAARCDTKGAKEATLAPKKRESRLAPTQGAAATNALAAAAVAMITTKTLLTNPPLPARPPLLRGRRPVGYKVGECERLAMFQWQWQ